MRAVVMVSLNLCHIIDFNSGEIPVLEEIFMYLKEYCINLALHFYNTVKLMMDVMKKKYQNQCSSTK